MGAPDSFDAKHIVRLDNPILEYDWGSRTALPELLGRPSPAAEFELSRLEVGSGTTLGVDAHGSVEILICTAGAVEVRPPAVAVPLSLAAGQSCLVPAGVGEYRFVGSGTLYRASVPR
jgi:mannose-6-phosphate isomerase class I